MFLILLGPQKPSLTCFRERLAFVRVIPFWSKQSKREREGGKDRDITEGYLTSVLYKTLTPLNITFYCINILVLSQ